jgi:serine/threonine-protein kinase RsbW
VGIGSADYEQDPGFPQGLDPAAGRVRASGLRPGLGSPQPEFGRGVPEVSLRMPAHPENIGVIRQAIVGVGEALDLDSDTVSNACLAVTEAVANVVVHAYGAPGGPLEVAIRTTGPLEVVVRDRGHGADVPSPGSGLGLGLPLIATLTDAHEIRRTRQGTTELAMAFSPVPR